MLEKLQLAEEKIEIDNIQSKHKKHQAFEAELGKKIYLPQKSRNSSGYFKAVLGDVYHKTNISTN